MADTGKQSPLGVNVLTSLLQNTGLAINSVAESYMGVRQTALTGSTGRVCNESCLRFITHAIHEGYTSLDNPTFANIMTLGQGTIPALGNSMSPAYTWTDNPTWLPYTKVAGAPVQWGFTGLFPLQAYNEFNYNSTLPEYRDFLMSFIQTQAFVDYTNSAIMSMVNAKTFLTGTYSNINDLTTADIAGVSTATRMFGQDLLNLGKAIDLSTIETFGMPSNLLHTIRMYDQTAFKTLSRVTEEAKIYDAFSQVTGQPLEDILILLNCGTKGIETLVDLLDPKKLFPNSYQTLTVPIYNVDLSTTNSKTYIPIYRYDGPNSQLYQSEFLSSTDGRSVAQRAFSMTMQQVRNIKAVPIEKFAQIVVNMETTKHLSVGTGSSPTQQSSIDAALALIAHGSGPYGTYTLSNFYGCMSGLPYDWAGLLDAIKKVESKTLIDLYKQLFLTVSWKPAVLSATTITRAVPVGGGLFDWQYKIVGFRPTNPGGGYGRMGAPIHPIATVAPNPTGVVCTPNVDYIGDDIRTYGRIANCTGSSSTWVTFSAGNVSPTPPVNVDSTITVTIQSPPTATPNLASPYPYGTATNTASGTLTFPNLSVSAQMFMAPINAEIGAILVAKPKLSAELTRLYDCMATQLTLEQRAISVVNTIGVPLTAAELAVRDDKLSSFPTSQFAFVDAIPEWGKDIKPHMYAQTLEAISDMHTVGGQSIVAMMRESRNADRLRLAGITQDNNIEGSLSPTETATLIANGTLPNAASGAGCPLGNTVPAHLAQLVPINGFTGPVNSLSTAPVGKYDPDTQDYIITSPGECEVPGDAAPTGAAIEPGSFAGNPHRRLVSPNLNTNYGSNTLLPSVPTVQEAIDDIVK
jgi:hypothetical protein